MTGCGRIFRFGNWDFGIWIELLESVRFVLRTANSGLRDENAPSSKLNGWIESIPHWGNGKFCHICRWVLKLGRQRSKMENYGYYGNYFNS
jgi:hypothetical protein